MAQADQAIRQRRALCALCSDAWRCGLLGGYSGNASLRLSGNRILITPGGVRKAALAPRDCCLATMDGRCSSTLQPSSEMPMHLAVYEANAHVQVILHTHPTALLALSLVRPEGPLLGTGLFEARALLSRLARIPPLPPGGTELAEAVARAASEHAAVWMERHGLVCVGSRPEDVLALSESLENLAKVELLVCSAVGRSGQTKDG